jgi:regulator of sirC expression with transglutaminase-like and TPR domain
MTSTTKISAAERFRQIVAGPDENIRLAEAALLIACGEYRDLDVGAYLARIDEMAFAFKRRLWRDISPADIILRLNRFLFDEQGFASNADDYHDPRNSFLNEVLDRKLGIPITLGLVYIEIGRCIGLPVQGVSFPAHFLVKYRMREGAVVLDPYAKGISLSLDDLRHRIMGLCNGVAPTKSRVAAMLGATSNREILIRMLHNLKNIYIKNEQWSKALVASDRIIAIMPDDCDEYRDRAMIYIELECFRAARADFQTYLEKAPDAEDAGVVWQYVINLQPAARLN